MSEREFLVAVTHTVSVMASDADQARERGVRAFASDVSFEYSTDGTDEEIVESDVPHPCPTGEEDISPRYFNQVSAMGRTDVPVSE